MSKKIIGDAGELELCKLVPCPNCGKELMTLPTNYPLYDLQCTGCSFRAQVKTQRSKPKNEVSGAGWEIMDKFMKCGQMVPALFVNFKWTSGHKILFYPFIPKMNLKKYQLSPTAKRANYKMFRYVKMLDLPHFVVYELTPK